MWDEMTPPTKAQRTLSRWQSPPIQIEIDDYEIIREALSLLHRVQSGEVKALGRNANDRMKEEGYYHFGTAVNYRIKQDRAGTVWTYMWDAAPAKPDSDGV